jgi:hypothetical protein
MSGRFHNPPGTVEKYPLGARLADMRLTIELIKPLLRMALMRPDLANELINKALMHLESHDRRQPSSAEGLRVIR